MKSPDAKDLNDHPEHFQLFEIGQFDDFNALFVPLTPPNLLVHGTAFADVGSQG